ncbi:MULTISPECIES: BlaI/MecI/CopY family transcriptional regulator [unclassified Wenzhouxiangella]|uniref:BlaI/MecI/CopY family transcriptional regulator n=1 Tax=unclassified Wenzhouxiangella TaxID=2613841 RepID=UPI000E3280F9|nr:MULTISPECIES: BlaI/MecI/CopY family transcriptional regulator [unclassified Wenzhouxiangella]
MSSDNASDIRSPMPLLGNLEVAVMERLWTESEWTAKALHDCMGVERGISLNTVQSTLERLHRKQLVKRRKQGHAFRYSPKVCRDELVAAYMRDMLGRLGGDPAASIAAFVESAEGMDEATIERLEAVLNRRRQEESR